MVDFNKIAEESRASIEKEDLKVLLPLVAEIKPKNILEIGAWKGYSAETWIQAFFPDHFLTIEKDTFENLEPFILHNMNYLYSFNHDSHSEETYDMVKRIVGNSSNDFLFIDGDHNLEGVKKDFEMYSPLVRKGGIIALHDVCYHADGTEEVDIFWNELKKSYPYVEIKVGKNSTGIGILYV